MTQSHLSGLVTIRRLCRRVLATSAFVAALVLTAAALAQTARVGQPAPDFTLTDTEGVERHLSDYTKDGKIVVLHWFNPTCVFIVKHMADHRTIVDVQQEFKDQDVVWLAINSGSVESGTADIALNREKQSEYGMEYPVLMDTSGDISRLYRARVTPHFFIIDRDGTLAYEGALDNHELLDEKIGDVNYVREALAALVKGDRPKLRRTRAYGCAIKY